MIVSIEIPFPQVTDGLVRECWENMVGGVTTVRGPSGFGGVDVVVTLRLTADQAHELRHTPELLYGQVLARWLDPEWAPSCSPSEPTK